VFTFVVLTWF